MTELLLQAALADSKATELVAQAAQIKANCHAQHGDMPSLISCPECYVALLEAYRTRFLGPSSNTNSVTTTTNTTTTGDTTTTAADQTQPQPQPQPSSQQQQQQAQQNHQSQSEWFTNRPNFLRSLNHFLDLAKAYKFSPDVIDARVRAERAEWCKERSRAPLLRRLRDEDPALLAVVSANVERFSSLIREETAEERDGPEVGVGDWGGVGGDGGNGKEDPVVKGSEITERLGKGTLGGDDGLGNDLWGKLAAVVTASAAGDDLTKSSTVDVLREAFFTAEDGITVPEEHQQYLEMLQHQGLSMEQVVERILEERQAAAGAKEQADKLSQRLDELRRARAAHEAHKSRKAQRRESLAQQKVADDLYDLPPCAVCGRAPTPSDYLCCSICTVLAGAGVLKQQRVYCSAECEEKDHASHAQTHTCAFGRNCTQAAQQDEHGHPTTGDGEDTVMGEAPPLPGDLRFCTECLTTLKQPTMYCSLACAEANFEAHSEELHPPARKKAPVDDGEGDGGLKLSGDERDGNKKSPPRDIGALTTSLSEVVRQWEDKNRVKLEAPV